MDSSSNEAPGPPGDRPAPGCALADGLPPEALQPVASYFQALSDPTRLQVLELLRRGERNVGELARRCGCTAANVSRHLSLLVQQGLVEREGRGTCVYYRIADESVHALCTLVCGNIARALERAAPGRRAVADAAQPDPARARPDRR